MGAWWQRNVVEPGKLPLLLCLVAFVVTFLATRTITRLIRAGRGPFHDVVSGSLHVHHSVPGLILLLAGSVTAIAVPPVAPGREIAGVIVGVGASLVLDEFALILRLEDDYWKEEGRASVQAVALVTACLACLLVGLSPFGVDDLDGAGRSLRLVGAAVVLVTIAATVVCVLKGKYRLALIAVFVPPVAYIGASRLARPGSRWDRRRYGARTERHRRAVERTRAFDARWDPTFRRLGDIVAGAPQDRSKVRSPGARRPSDP